MKLIPYNFYWVTVEDDTELEMFICEDDKYQWWLLDPKLWEGFIPELKAMELTPENFEAKGDEIYGLSEYLYDDIVVYNKYEDHIETCNGFHVKIKETL